MEDFYEKYGFLIGMGFTIGAIDAKHAEELTDELTSICEEEKKILGRKKDFIIKYYEIVGVQTV